MRRFSCALLFCCLALLAVAAVSTSAHEEEEWIQPTFIEEEPTHPRVWQQSSGAHLGPSEVVPRSLVSTESQVGLSVEAQATARARAALGATVTAQGKTEAELMTEIHARAPALWQAFKTKFKKQYANDAARYAIFTRNLVQIAQLNARVAAHSTLPVSLRAVFSHDHGLADLSDDEFKKLRTSQTSTGSHNLHLAPKAPRRKLATPGQKAAPKAKAKKTSSKKVFLEVETEVGTEVDAEVDVDAETEVDTNAPLDCDWRSLSSPIRFQGSCGSCWAHSAAATLETAFAIKYNTKLVLSPQQLVDCNKNAASHGCSYGQPMSALNWWAQNGGAASEAQIPYDGYQHSTCTLTKNAKIPGLSSTAIQPVFPVPVPVNITMAIQWANPFSTTPQDENELGHQLSSRGVMSVLIDSRNLQHHAMGVLDSASLSCSTKPKDADHAVNLEGLTTDPKTGVRYWILRNSWGDWWGEKGRFYFKYGENTCGFANEPIQTDVYQLGSQ